MADGGSTAGDVMLASFVEADGSALTVHSHSGVHFTVNSTNDGQDANTADNVCQTATEGECTLRAAIEQANGTAVKDSIHFAIPGAPPYTIVPTPELPTIRQPVIIDATTQPGYDGEPLVELSGASAGSGASGLTITAGGSTVRGLVVNRFQAVGIFIAYGGGNSVQANYIGTDTTGTLARGNGSAGGIKI